MSKKKTLQKKNTAPAKKYTKDNTAPTNDIRSKTIFQNPVLCCQFLKNYVDHPLLKNIQPEDIEDYTDHFISYFGVEFGADTIKRIHLRNSFCEIRELYLISLIEHKSKVDYNVTVQLLKYMTCIWIEYEKKFGSDYKDQVKTKEFRYPPILPVVYHEGTDTWTAPMHLKDRIFLSDIFEDYIPDFTYCLVNNRDYSKEELLGAGNEMSLIMLLNKIQTKADLSDFLSIPPDEINCIVKESPEAVIDIIVMVMQALCTKLNLSKQDTAQCVEKVRTRNMGYLWENMEKIDVQGTYEALTQAKAELADVQAELADAQAELIGAQAELAGAQAENITLKETSVKVEAENTRLKALLAAHGIKASEFYRVCQVKCVSFFDFLSAVQC